MVGRGSQARKERAHTVNALQSSRDHTKTACCFLSESMVSIRLFNKKLGECNRSMFLLEKDLCLII